MSFLGLAGAFILGGILGWGATTLYSPAINDSGLPTVGIGGGPTDDRTINQEALLPLNNLMREHGNLAVLHLQAIYDDKDLLPTGQQLDTNSQQLADLFSGVFGAQAGEQIQPMWKDHINEYVNYTHALKNNDQAEMERARTRLTELGNEMGEMFEDANQNLSSDEVATYLKEHITLTLNIIDSHARGDQDAMVKQIKAANEQATQFATFITEQLNNASESPPTTSSTNSL